MGFVGLAYTIRDWVVSPMTVYKLEIWGNQQLFSPRSWNFQNRGSKDIIQLRPQA